MEISNRTLYRVWQFWHVVKARPLDQEDQTEIATILNPVELKLFYRQDISGQQHAMRVMRTLREAGQDDGELLAAALLHDVGKTKAHSKWWDKPVVVLGQTFLPVRSANWASGEKGGWQRPFVVKRYHADWGADAAASSGSSPLTVSLIRRHQEHPQKDGQNREEKLLALLQWADNQS